jgi:hypothetical protein
MNYYIKWAMVWPTDNYSKNFEGNMIKFLLLETRIKECP